MAKWTFLLNNCDRAGLPNLLCSGHLTVLHVLLTIKAAGQMWSTCPRFSQRITGKCLTFDLFVWLLLHNPSEIIILRNADLHTDLDWHTSHSCFFSVLYYDKCSNPWSISAMALELSYDNMHGGTYGLKLEPWIQADPQHIIPKLLFSAIFLWLSWCFSTTI